MDGSLASVIFKHTSLPSPPLIQYAEPEESVHELQYRLVCTSMELETAREAAKLQIQMNEAKLRELQELLDNTKKERDEAFQECKKLKKCLSHLSESSVDQAINAGSASADSSGHVNNNFQQSSPSSTSFIESGTSDEKHIQSELDLQDILGLGEIDEPSSILSELEQLSNNFWSDCGALVEDRSFGDSFEQFSLDVINEEMKLQHNNEVSELVQWSPSSTQTSAHAQSRSGVGLSHNPGASCSASNAYDESSVPLPVYGPLDYSQTMKNLHGKQASASVKAVAPTTVTSLSQPTFADTQKQTQPSQLAYTAPSSTIYSPPQMPNHSNHIKTHVLPDQVCMALPSTTPTQSVMYQMCGAAAPLPYPTISPPNSPPKSSSQAPAMTTTSCDRQHQAATTVLPRKRVHLPEPPEANMDVMLRSLPKKGRLLEAVINAGPLLQQLLIAAPLPQWQCAPAKFNNIDIPKAPMSPTSVLAMPVPYVQDQPYMAVPATPSPFSYMMVGYPPCFMSGAPMSVNGSPVMFPTSSFCTRIPNFS